MTISSLGATIWPSPAAVLLLVASGCCRDGVVKKAPAGRVILGSRSPKALYETLLRLTCSPLELPVSQADGLAGGMEVYSAIPVRPHLLRSCTARAVWPGTGVGTSVAVLRLNSSCCKCGCDGLEVDVGRRDKVAGSVACQGSKGHVAADAEQVVSLGSGRHAGRYDEM